MDKQWIKKNVFASCPQSLLQYSKESKILEGPWKTFLENMKHTHTHTHKIPTHLNKIFYIFAYQKNIFYCEQNRCVRSFISVEFRLYCYYDHHKSGRNIMVLN